MAKVRKFQSQFAQVPNAMLQDSRLSFKARGLWAYMQSLPDDWDFAVERIAEGKDGKDAVRSGLRELEAAGYLSRKMISVGAGGSETEYSLSVPVAENPTAQTVAVAENPPAGNPPADIGITKKQVTDKYKSQGAIAPSVIGQDEMFEAFWESYPRKVGKGSARSAFAKALKKADVQDIAQGFKRFLASVEGKEERFIPHATTWLNGERWLDQSNAKPETSKTPHFQTL